jgi:phosphomannomutase
LTARARRQPRPARRPIRFGTSGWRGTLGDEITDERVVAFVQAAAGWLARRRSGRRVLVAFDGRFASERLAELTARSLQARGLDVVLASGVTPTPALARAVPRRRAAGGLMLTASHNPAHDHGIKLFGPRGEPVSPRDAARIEQAAARALVRPLRDAARRGRCSRADLAASYARDLARASGEALRTAPRLRVVYDAMHGAGGGVFDAALRAAGTRVEVLRAEADPRFGGSAPDPTAEQLALLARRVRAGRGLRLGLATDGDADRVAAVDETGRVLAEGEQAALLLDHLARTGRVRRGVALTLAVGSLVERVAAAHALRAVRLPIGFKYLAAELLAGRADVAIDESGGVAFAPFAVDKDGMLAGALLAESVAVRRRGLGAQLAELREHHGAGLSGRRALPAAPELRDALERLCAAPPERFGAQPVAAVDARDGLRLELDDGFVMWRASGTEPLVRIYADAPGARPLRVRLAAAERWLRRRSSG